MSLSLKPLNEQVIVITGASSGIGLATAEAAAKKAAKLVLAARSSGTLDQIVERINSEGGSAIAVTADVSDRNQVKQIAEAAISRFGRIDTWVNNAGLAIYGRLDEVSDEDNRRLFDINFWGVVNGSLTALPYLKSQGGALINLGSEASEAVAPMLGMYCASKHAVKGFTDSLRVEIEEVDKAPVSITLIQPTAVDTPFDEHARNYMPKEANLPHPMVNPEDVAEAILDSAVKPTRYRKVGMMSKVNTFVAKNMPGVADRMAGGMVEKFQREEPATDTQGTLHVPGESGQTHGYHPA